MLIVYVVALLGIFRFRSVSYWKWVVFLIAWMFGAQFLFAGGGTLEDPAGDGLVSHQIRIATNDGPGMGLFALVFIVAYWGGAIWIMRKAYVAGKRFEEAGEAEEIEPVAVSRKTLEALTLTAVAGIYIYFAFGLPRQAVKTQPVADSATSTKIESGDPIADELSAAAEQMSREGPKKIDPITTLASVSAEGRTLTYHYEIARRDLSDETLRDFSRKNAITLACRNPEMNREMKDYGIIYRYSYLSPNSAAPVVVDATYAKCRALNIEP